MPTATKGIPRTSHSVGPWPLDLAHLLPADVKAASDALAEAMGRRESAGEVEAAAREAVEAARRADSDAAIFAADNGEPAPKPTLSKAEAKLVAAERESEALKVVVGRRQESYLVTVRDSHAQLCDALAAELGTVGEELGRAFDRCEAGLLRAASLQDARRELGNSPDELAGRSVNFMPPVQRRRGRERDPLLGDCRRSLDTLRELARAKG